MCAYEIETIVTSRFRLDGGSMFGVVPKALWEKKMEADSQNRISMVSRIVLLKRPDKTVILINTGFGEPRTERERKIFAVEDKSLTTQLDQRGISATDVTHVLSTHLHFDHVGGHVKIRSLNGGVDADSTCAQTVQPSFPNAVYLVSKRQWKWACSPNLKDRGSYRRNDFQPLMDAGLLKAVDTSHGRTEILESVFVEELRGHTPGMWFIRITDGKTRLAIGTDLFPTRFHLKAQWNMAFDNEPLVTVGEKQALLSDLFYEKRLLILEHDPDVEAVRLIDKSGSFKAVSL